jgi:AcrR family transcriptional regulator
MPVSNNSPSARARPPQPSGGRKSDATRRRILDAAAATFRAKGYAGARLSDIAAAAETQAGSLYYYFDSKDELLEAVLDIGVTRVFDFVRTAVEALPANASWRLKITTAIESHLAMALHLDTYSSANIRIFGQIPDDIRNRHQVLQRRYGKFWRDLLEGAAADGAIRRDLDLSVVRMMLLGSLNWSVEWYKPNGQTAREIGAQFGQMLFDGLTDGTG